MTKLLIVYLLIFSFPASAHESVFGIGLGDQFLVKKCEKGLASHELCYDDMLSKPVIHPWGSTSYSVIVPPGATRWGIQQYGFRVVVFSGVVTQVSITTFGYNYQDEVFADLVKKFGKPTSKKVNRLQNSFGAKIDGIKAQWEKKDVTVDFDGVWGNINDGFVTISSKTEASEAENKAAADYKRAKATPPVF